MRTRRYNYYALAQPGVLFNAPEGGDGGGAGDGDAAATAAAAQAATDAAAKTATDAAAKTASDAATKTAADAAAATAAAQDVKSLPEWAQKIITDTRKEAGDARGNAKAAAAEEARAEMAQTIGKALGLVKDETLTAEQLAAQVKTSTDEARSAKVELAVYKASGAHQANPTALLDSRSFLAKVADLDPSKKDFDTKVADAIKDAVKDHPELKVALAAARNSVNHTGGTGEGANKPQTLDQALAGHYGT
jgi:hypothetical protein